MIVLRSAWIWACLCLGLAGAALAQEAENGLGADEPAEQTAEVELGTGAALRGLDKVNAQVSDLSIATGAEAEFGRLAIRVEECRFPFGDPAADAYAYLVIRDISRGEQVFEGWMLASSPALNALEHPRYDVWVLRCTTPE